MGVTGNDGKRAAIWDRGPAWITALCGLLALLFGGGILVGHAITPTTAPPTTMNQPGSSSGPMGGATVDQSKPGEGAVLATYPVDVSAGYGISFSADRPHPVKTGMNGADLHYMGSGDMDTDGQFAVLNTPTTSYADCRNNTRYTSYLPVKLGQVVCFTGHGVIAAIKATNKGTDTDFVSFDVTVWQGPP